EGRHRMTKLTDGYYGWRGLSWARAGGRDGLVGSTDRTSTGAYNLFYVDPARGSLERVTVSDADQTAPEAVSGNGGSGLLFRSWASGSSQIHMRTEGREVRLTAVDTLV